MEQTAKPSAEEQLLYIVIKYKKALIGALVVIVTLGAGAFFGTRYQEQREQEAALQLSRVSPALEQGNFTLAINGTKQTAGLQKIANEYSGRFIGTPSGNMAKLLLANAWYSFGKYETALQHFNEVTIAHEDLAAAALAGSGDCYLNLNKLKEAAEAYQKAANKTDNRILKAQYLTHEATAYHYAKDFPKATELYKTVIASYPGTTAASIAQHGLWQLSGSL
uniref:TPR repeat n=1 Tax=Chlorobium chlorochromatii (strain CaD3) TaxID=340177 RepID=Q3AQW7_CHLCH